MTFIQCWTNDFDVGPTLYKCHTNVLCLLGWTPLYSATTTIEVVRHPDKLSIHFKICTITFRALKDNQPACIYRLHLFGRPQCSKYLRSTNSNSFLCCTSVLYQLGGRLCWVVSILATVALMEISQPANTKR